MTQLTARSLDLAYDRRVIVEDLDLALPEGRITVLVGANGSGKSTLLRGLSRLLPPQKGQVLLDGDDIRQMRATDLARRLGLLPQTPIAPDGVSVRELVSRGRYPHQGLFPHWSDVDEQAVAEALAVTRVAELQERAVDELSGGQRQRVWIAMALAQRTDVLLLDEPTTYLDVTHQLEVLDVIRELNRERGTTVAIVLHDLALAARYADHLIAVRDGSIHAQGAPVQVITADTVREVFALEAIVRPDPVTGTPLVLPLAREGAATSTAGDFDGPEDALRMEPADEDPREPSAPSLVPVIEASQQLAFPLTVLARRQVGANLLRLTLTGPDLVHLGVGGGPLLDLRVKLIFPGTGQDRDHLAALRPDAIVAPENLADWYRTWMQVDPEHRGRMRTYSVRELRGAGHPGNIGIHAELDIDLVLHIEDNPAPGTGVAARWAASAQVGDPITLLGPNAHLLGPDYGGIEFRPGPARRLLLAGDETALPAICAILETLPEGFTGHALIEVPDAADAQRVLTRSDIEISWLARGDGPHGSRLDPAVRELLDARPELCADCRLGIPEDGADGADAGAVPFEDVDPDAAILWETTVGRGPFYAWLAGEAKVITGLRRHLVKELGVDRRQVSFMGYWRQGRAEG